MEWSCGVFGSPHKADVEILTKVSWKFIKSLNCYHHRFWKIKPCDCKLIIAFSRMENNSPQTALGNELVPRIMKIRVMMIFKKMFQNVSETILIPKKCIIKITIRCTCVLLLYWRNLYDRKRFTSHLHGCNLSLLKQIK